MKLESAKIIKQGTWAKEYTMTDVIVDLCDVQGFNTVFDDDDSVVMRNHQFLAVLSINANNCVHVAYYRR